MEKKKKMFIIVGKICFIIVGFFFILNMFF